MKSSNSSNEFIVSLEIEILFYELISRKFNLNKFRSFKKSVGSSNSESLIIAHSNYQYS